MLVELLAEVLRHAEHEDTSAGGVIFPVLVEDLPSLINLVRAICHECGVPFLLADDLVDDGVEDSPAIAANRAIFEGVAHTANSLMTLSVQESGGRTTVRWVAPPDAANRIVANPGDRNVLGAMTALISSEFAGQPCCVLAYDEEQIDAVGRQLLWDAFLDRSPKWARGQLPSTLVLLIGGRSIDFPHHCRKGNSLRWALTRSTGRCRRNLWDSSWRDITGIAGDTRPLILFLGAGFSASSGLPLGDELRNVALENVLREEGGSAVDGPALAAHFFQYFRDKERLLEPELHMTNADLAAQLTLERVLREEFNIFGVDDSPTLAYFRDRHVTALTMPGAAVQQLAHVVALRKSTILVTVNFDELIEAAIPSDQLRSFVSDEECSLFSEYLREYLTRGGPTPLLKLHGSISRLESLVATVDATALGLSRAKTAAVNALPDIDGGGTLAYVGYSMRDPDVLRVLNQTSFAETLTEWWVAPLPDRGVHGWVTANREEIWTNMRRRHTVREHLITESADVFLAALVAQLESKPS